MSTKDLDGYKPTADEEFMNELQLAYFRKKLETWKQDIIDGSKTTIGNLQEDTNTLADIVDRASAESDKALELRTRDRQRKLISKIDGTYGYCEMTGEPIALGRLEARPTATLSLEAQEAHERNEKTVRDD